MWTTGNGDPIIHVVVHLPSGGFAIYTNIDFLSGKIQYSENPANLSIIPVTASSLNRLDRLLTETGFTRLSSPPVAGR